MAQTRPDLVSGFDAETEGWRTSTSDAAISWKPTDGTPDGYLSGTGLPGTNIWHFVSPTSWSGDWTDYKVLMFDFSIVSRHYPDVDRAGMVVIQGNNGQEMTWTGSTPIWTWVHYEVSLAAQSFGVDQETFDAIIADVAELRILAEFSEATETLGLDSVVVTAEPPEEHGANLVSRFTDGTDEGWRTVDDVTLSVVDVGLPGPSLNGVDWMDGRLWKYATPLSWSGDWRQFKALRFNMHWTGEQSYHESVEVIRIFGANGQTLSWNGSVTAGVWMYRNIPLTAETFGVSPELLEETLSHVSEMWIMAEWGGARDVAHLDNVELTTGPSIFTQSLISRFDDSDEGWFGYDNATVTWAPDSGISGSALKSVDGGTGQARFQSPNAWAGDWRRFQTLRFMVRIQTNRRADYPGYVEVVGWDGQVLRVDLPAPWPSWTPYTVALTPETFNVEVEEFEAVMSDVASMRIYSDFITGSGNADTTFLDNVMLLTENDPGLPPDRWSGFEDGDDGWRYGGWNTGSEDWSFRGMAPHSATDGNPDGNLQNTDTDDWTYWFTPETWAGDWRGLESVAFDFKIIQGTPDDLFETRMISICSPWANLHADVEILPVPGQWERFSFELTPDTFGVSQEVFDQVMGDVTFLGIRSEWIIGAERQGLDNVRISKADENYWNWISQFFTSTEMADENITGKFADPDLDESDNWSEFNADTIPKDANSVLRIISIEPTEAGLRVRWTGGVESRQILERTFDLTEPISWQPIITKEPPTMAEEEHDDTVQDSDGQYYRVKAVRP